MFFIIEILCTELIWLDSSGAVSAGHVAARTLNPVRVHAMALSYTCFVFEKTVKRIFVENGV